MGSLTISPTSGTGNKTVNVAAEPNLTDTDISSTFRIKTAGGVTKDVTVTIEGIIQATVTLPVASSPVRYSGFTAFADTVNVDGLPSANLFYPYLLSSYVTSIPDASAYLDMFQLTVPFTGEGSWVINRIKPLAGNCVKHTTIGEDSNSEGITVSTTITVVIDNKLCSTSEPFGFTLVLIRNKTTITKEINIMFAPS